ncbi:MAG TPA: DUF2950 family protein, partial [Bryobacteraceae bacterium]|nr:DUF2950 family protein [Bryobacteraceae bacterium]
NGKWHFDAARGNMEILARRIGRNELAVIDACRAFVEAEMEFAAKDHTPDKMLQYAPKIVSSPGKVDGLYTPNGKDNLVPEDFANAAATAYNVARHREPYHGYYFRILTAQGPNAEGGAMSYVVNRKMIGGFALLAYPAEYGVSGVKTFLVNYHGIVYEKDLGPNTVTLVPKITRFDPDKTWKPVRGE